MIYMKSVFIFIIFYRHPTETDRQGKPLNSHSIADKFYWDIWKSKDTDKKHKLKGRKDYLQKIEREQKEKEKAVTNTQAGVNGHQARKVILLINYFSELVWQHFF